MDKPKTTNINLPISQRIMDQDQVSIKVSLFTDKSGTKTQVRRLMVPQDMSTSFLYLKERIRQLFAAEVGVFGLDISWHDQDEDIVTIDSDEELIIALQEMKGPVYRFNVTLRDSMDPPKATPKGGQSKNTEAHHEIHPGVVCDNCDGQILGFRYKCMVCPDYDLCMTCEAKGLHPGHNMMRIASPEGIWPRHMFSRLHKMQSRAAKRQEARASQQENSEEQENSGLGPRMGRGMFRGGCQRGRGNRGWGSVPPFMGAMGGQNGGWNDLYNIGEAVRAALDPFGVDVDIDVQTHDKEEPEKAKEAKEKVPKRDEQEPKSVEIPVKVIETTKEPQIVPEKTPELKTISEKTPELEKVPEKTSEVKKVPEKTPEPVKEVPKESGKPKEDEEWTFLAANKSKSGTPEPPKTQTGASALYPTLETQEKRLSPKAQVALQSMLNMGFHDNGGWLTDLVEKHDGDIGKVLDTLTPVRSTRS